MEPKFETIQLESPEMGKKQIEQSYRKFIQKFLLNLI
jgi:hypothetical protein